jgi:hypothetical protein
VPSGCGERPDYLTGEALPVTIASLRLRVDPAWPPPRIDHLRAAIAAVQPELDLLHQHGPEGPIYRYPRIIYRVEHGVPLVVAIAEGVDTLLGLLLVGRTIRLGATVRRIVDATFDVTGGWIGVTHTSLRYDFTTPWLALNQANYHRYRSADRDGQQRLLEAQIVNNCLSTAKSFGLRISSRLSAIAHPRPVPVKFKGVEMLGFLGRFEVNFALPDGFGLGKSVSKGYGAVRGGI